MIHIRPVSDLRNKFTEIENTVRQGEPVYLTKNGYGTMVVMSIEQYSSMADAACEIERKLDEADMAAAMDSRRLTMAEVFDSRPPIAPPSVNADAMTVDELRAALMSGYEDMRSGSVEPADGAFARFRAQHR